MYIEVRDSPSSSAAYSFAAGISVVQDSGGGVASLDAVAVHAVVVARLAAVVVEHGQAPDARLLEIAVLGQFHVAVFVEQA